MALVRSKKYLALVRAEGCLVCQRPAQAHHLRLGHRTMGVRKSDHRCVPLCADHHAELHTMNEEIFWALKGIDPEEWVSRFLKRINGG